MRSLGLALLAVLCAGLAALAAGGSTAGRLLLAAGLPEAASALLSDPAWRGVALLRAGDPAAAAEVLRQTRSPEAAYNLGNALALGGHYADALKAYDLALLRDPDDTDAAANRALVKAAIDREAAVDKEGEDGLGLANSGSEIDHESGRDDTSGDDGGAQSSLGDGMVGGREAGSDAEAQGSGKVSRKGTPKSNETDSGEGSTRGSATDASGKAGTGGGTTEMAESEETLPPSAPDAAEQETMQATLQWLAAIPDDPGRFLRLRIEAERERRIRAGTAIRPGGSGW